MNNRIKQNRELALSLLKASAKEIDHGLRLHAESVVVDAYGFGVYSAVDDAGLKEKARSGAGPTEIKNLVEKMLFTRAAYDISQQEEFLQAWEASGVTCVLKNSGEESNSLKILIKRMAHNIYVTDVLKARLSKAISAEDIIRAKKDARYAYCLTTNGVPLAERWDSKEQELEFIDLFRQLGVRMMHLTYNRRNLIGDGCAESSDAGLSDFGKAVIKELNRCGIIPDVAHSGLQTSFEAAKVSEKPVVASHTACRALNEHCRNKSNDVIKAIAESGGIIGVCCIPAFLGRTGDINAMLDHIDYLVRLVGSDHVSIGTDRSYVCSGAGCSDMDRLYSTPQRKIFENYWQEGDALFAEEWNQPQQYQSMEWTNWPLFTVGLVQRGHSDEDIRKIIGGNMLRLL